jgi:hypothetical protein
MKKLIDMIDSSDDAVHVCEYFQELMLCNGIHCEDCELNKKIGELD